MKKDQLHPELEKKQLYYLLTILRSDLITAGYSDHYLLWQHKKGADYGTNEDQYPNIRASEEFGIPGWLGAVVRANDKMARIKTYCKKGKLENESLKESIMDVAVYFLNAYMILAEDENEICKQSRTNITDTATNCWFGHGSLWYLFGLPMETGSSIINNQKLQLHLKLLVAFDKIFL